MGGGAVNHAFLGGVASEHLQPRGRGDRAVQHALEGILERIASGTGGHTEPGGVVAVVLGGDGGTWVGAAVAEGLLVVVAIAQASAIGDGHQYCRPLSHRASNAVIRVGAIAGLAGGVAVVGDQIDIPEPVIDGRQIMAEFDVDVGPSLQSRHWDDLVYCKHDERTRQASVMGVSSRIGRHRRCEGWRGCPLLVDFDVDQLRHSATAQEEKVCLHPQCVYSWDGGVADSDQVRGEV